MPPDTEYITNNRRVDILAKPLADGDVALCFINLDTETAEGRHSVTADRIFRYIGAKMVRADRFKNARCYRITDLWTGETTENDTGEFFIENPDGCDSVTLRISPVGQSLRC